LLTRQYTETIVGNQDSAPDPLRRDNVDCYIQFTFSISAVHVDGIRNSTSTDSGGAFGWTTQWHRVGAAQQSGEPRGNYAGVGCEFDKRDDDRDHTLSAFVAPSFAIR
jgi:hypothetical protein